MTGAHSESRPAPGAGQVLRRSLVLWGMGHVMLGDRRGWLLLALQPFAIVTVALLCVLLADGTQWLECFLLLVGLIVVWIGQAISAHRRALGMGGAPGGEMAVALFLPLPVAALTAFWLVGGRVGSPGATLQQYIADWSADRPAAAAGLFVSPPSAEAVALGWERERGQLIDHLKRGLETYGTDSGLDPDDPLNSLRITQAPDTAEGDARVAMTVEIVRSERVQTTLLGFLPSAGQQTVVVAPEMIIWLELDRRRAPDWLPLAPLDSFAWKISTIEATTQR